LGGRKKTKINTEGTEEKRRMRRVGKQDAVVENTKADRGIGAPRAADLKFG
jgi:hypothetical protein